MPAQARPHVHNAPPIAGAARLLLAMRAAASRPRRAAAGAPPDNSLFGSEIPCSGPKNSLFGEGRELMHKPFKLLRDLVRAIAKMARISRNSLLNSLFSGNSPRRMALARGAAQRPALLCATAP